MPLLICRTCPRHDPRRSGVFADRFRDALDEAAVDQPDVAIRMVQCLGGCPADGVVALDAPGKNRVRFTGLGSADAAAVATASAAYERSVDGHPDGWPVPPSLAAHLRSVTPKRGPIG